ncbi:MAG: DUF2339 domain-containing protein, partial [Candidatus Gracilibacteria bacterium]|nr:DUF2339 domain-containing protein [Candidatus Gracilibacteria bacterium]
ITGFLFMISTYFLSSKKDLSYLYTIGTLASIFIFWPIIKITLEFTQVSIFAIILFGIITYLTPFINSNLVKNDSKNLVLGNIFGILFIGGNLFRFGNEYFPGVSLGIGFFALAVLYFVGGFVLFNKFEKVETSNKESNLNFIYTFFAIAISLFSIAVALVFSKLPLVIAFIWLVESSIVLFFANKLNSTKVLTAGIILFIIGLVKYFSMLVLNLVGVGLNYNDLVGVGLIALSLFLNIVFIKDSLLTGKSFIKILHLIGLFLVYLSLINIFDLDNNSGSIFIFSGIYLGIIGIIYNIFKDNFLKISYILFLSLIFVVHIGDANYVNNYTNNYTFTFIAGILVIIDYLFLKDKNTKFLCLIFGIYFFIITSIYLYHFTNDYFSLTIYWGILSLVGVHLGIGNSNKIIRSIGLYLLIITLLKISFYDIWNSIDNPILRIIAFMFVGGLMMYISTLYSKNNLSIKSDFSFKLGGNNDDLEKNNNIKSEPKSSQVKKSEININEKIENIDVSNIENLKFILLNGKKFSIKSKNLFKVVILIINNLGKSSFEAEELENIYNTIVNNYKTNLNESDYKKLLGVIKEFVDIGGKVEVIKK